jgi:two-component system, NarL family, nitrate/nitrite response regulator NarL
VARQSSGSSLILIVDPEQDAREPAAEVLSRAGYSTREVESGEEALAIAKRERPRVVVLEICLPGICGYEVCRELREAFGEELAILFLSGIRKESFDRVAGLLIGADDYLVKPFAADELLARVRTLIRRSPPPTPGLVSNLTRREQDVFQLLVEGLDQKTIATRLCISPRTVGTHTEHIFAKLGVHSRSEAVAVALRHKLVDRVWLNSALVALAASGGDVFEWLSAPTGPLG